MKFWKQIIFSGKRFRLWCFLFVMMMFASNAMAQLQVTMETEFGSFLQYEKLNAFVLISNNTSVPFVIDSDDDKNQTRLRFFVERGERNEIMSKFKKEPLIRKLKLQPGEKREIIVDISKWYDVREMNRYLVRCDIDWNGRTTASAKRMIDIVGGIESSTMTKSVPWNPGIIRKYSLRYWPREKGEYLFLRIDDEEGSTNYGVLSVGRMLRIAQPSVTVDDKGKVRVVHQVSRDRFAQSIYMTLPSGVIFVDQNYYLPNGKPYPAKAAVKRSLPGSQNPSK